MADPKPTTDEARAEKWLRGTDVWVLIERAHDDPQRWKRELAALLAEVRAEATGTTVARYHILLQDIYAVLNPEEHDALCERVMDALENCPPACSRPECEEIGFEKGKAEGAREERARANRWMARVHEADFNGTLAEARYAKLEKALRRAMIFQKGMDAPLVAELRALLGAEGQKGGEG